MTKKAHSLYIINTDTHIHTHLCIHVHIPRCVIAYAGLCGTWLTESYFLVNFVWNQWFIRATSLTSWLVFHSLSFQLFSFFVLVSFMVVSSVNWAQPSIHLVFCSWGVVELRVHEWFVKGLASHYPDTPNLHYTASYVMPEIYTGSFCRLVHWHAPPQEFTAMQQSVWCSAFLCYKHWPDQEMLQYIDVHFLINP